MRKKINSYFSKIKDKKILIHGLGINGGGVASALFFLKKGLDVTITDLKKASELSKSIDQLANYSKKIKYVLGEHKKENFMDADIVVKGPGISPCNEYIKVAKQNNACITSDIEIFLNLVDCFVYAITGSKGKSTTVSAIYYILKQKTSNVFLGGNITISPLTFYEKLDINSIVILELSSWQLRDLKSTYFKFKGCAITNLLNDHQDYYSSMKEYLEDKIIIAKNQTKKDFLLLPDENEFLKSNTNKINAKKYYFSRNNIDSNYFYDGKWACYKINLEIEKIFSVDDIITPGEHMKINLLIAAAFCCLIGLENKYIVKGIKSFKGIPFRMELIRKRNGIKFFNDTTATIPDAACNAILSFKEPVIWIAGGNDKNLDFSILSKVSNLPKKIFLLTGNGTKKMRKYLKRDDIIESESLEYLLNKALEIAARGDTILFSPGCTSFGLFQNEFHRGEVFNRLVRGL